MGKSQRLRVQDVRGIFRAVGECCEIGDDPVLWRQHLGRSLERLIGSQVTMVGEMTGFRRGPVRDCGLVDRGWENGFDRRAWLLVLAQLAEQKDFHIAFLALSARLREVEKITCERAELVDDDVWYRSSTFQNIHRAAGSDALLYSAHKLRPIPDRFQLLICNRGLGERQFSTRELAILKLAHEELAPLVGGALAGGWEPEIHSLSVRTRQVLAGLLQGDAEKQIAYRLCISPTVVHEYVGKLYRHFQVNSRGELAARWVRRGWGRRHAWLPELK
jgi:DNA-binding CsgD family transcriptional regulator